jgi:hypothetical protein
MNGSILLGMTHGEREGKSLRLDIISAMARGGITTIIVSRLYSIMLNNIRVLFTCLLVK